MRSRGTTVVIAIAAVLLTGIVLWSRGARAPEVVEVKTPCNTFVSEFAPTRTPALRTENQTSELMISFTPAKDEEANRISVAVAAGTTRLLLAPSGTEAKALRVENSRLVVAVKNEDNAKELLRLLCFAEAEVSSLPSRTAR